MPLQFLLDDSSSELKTALITLVCQKKNDNNAIYLNVNVLSTKVLIDGTIFTSPTGDWTDDYFFSQLFLSICPSPGIEPSTFRSVVKCSSYLS